MAGAIVAIDPGTISIRDSRLSSDNGSEFVNYNVAKLLGKLLIEQTKSRPRQHSTGGRTKLLGISKRGSEYLMLHGARSVVMH